MNKTKKRSFPPLKFLSFPEGGKRRGQETMKTQPIHLKQAVLRAVYELNRGCENNKSLNCLQIRGVFYRVVQILY